MQITDPLVYARFWSKVDVKGPTQCWYWKGAINPAGYGRFVSDEFVGEDRAHRISLMLAGVSVPKHLNALHRCDVRRCVNPSHLFIGSQRDNIRDMIAKGRKKFGAKLTKDEVRQIKAHLSAGESLSSIARAFSVSPGAISHIRNGITWKHIS